MAARRCAECAINYPPPQQRCPIHDVELEWRQYEFADSDWQQRVDKARELASADGLIPPVTGRIRAIGDSLFIWAWDVWPAKRRRLDPGELFRVGKQTFQVLAYEHEARRYRVAAFSTTLSDEDLRSLADG